MGILGSAIGGALGIGGSIFGGISASKAMKRIKKNLEGQKQENESWYNRRYNEDATQRADAQRILTLTNENIRNRNRQAAGTQAIMGGTEESVAAAKVKAAGGIVGWANKHPGAPLRVYMSKDKKKKDRDFATRRNSLCQIYVYAFIVLRYERAKTRKSFIF